MKAFYYLLIARQTDINKLFKIQIIMSKSVGNNDRIQHSFFSKEQHQDEYGFFCDLESPEEEEIEYYVVTTCTHYEVRRKLKSRPKIQGDRKMIIKLDSAKSSTDDLQSKPTVEGKNICSTLLNVPKDVFYSICVCFTTCSCIYLVMTS